MRSWQAWMIAACMALAPLPAVVEWRELQRREPALCRSCVLACPSTAFVSLCVPPERWHVCPACGAEWRGRKDFAPLY